MRCWLVAVALLASAVAHAETPESPYRVTWSFPNDDLSTIDVDRGDLSVSRFASAIELAKYLRQVPKGKKAKATAAPGRELRIEQVDAAGKVRSTDKWIAPIEEWRTRLGERMVERLEDEFDAHLRMILPRKREPVSAP